MTKTGPKLSLNEKKLKALFPAMLIAPQDKYIANALGVKPQTIKLWVANGEAIQDKFEDLLEPLDEIFSFEYEDVFESRKPEFEDQFKLLYDIGLDEKIPDRLRLEYNNFMQKEKSKFIENNIQRRENEILDGIQLGQTELQDKEFKLYLKFWRIYNRARCAKEMSYLQNIDKHAGSSKNVGLSLKMLEKLNKEDFAETQTVTHEGSIMMDTKSVLSLAINWEKQQREQQLLDKKDENIIDVKPVNLLEVKKESL